MNRPAISIPAHRTKSWTTLQSLNREQGVTIVVVTHEPDIAAYADRTVTMRDGQIISDERVAKRVALSQGPDAPRQAPDMSLFHPKEQPQSNRREI